MSTKRRKCAFVGCDSVGPPCRMYTFPASNPERCRQWIIISGNEGLVDELLSSPKKLLQRCLCEKHFSQNKFTSCKKNRLIANALPSYAFDEQQLENGIAAPRSSLPPECSSDPLSLPKKTGQHLPFKEEKEENRRMQGVIACAVCLSTDESALQDMRSNLLLCYHLITGLQLDGEKGMPRHLCYECAALLGRCNKFRDKCHRSFRIMNEIILKSKNKLSQEDIASIDREDNRLTSPLRSSDLSAITYCGPLDNDVDVKDSVSPAPEYDSGSQIDIGNLIEVKIEYDNSESDDEQNAENRHDSDNLIFGSLAGSDKDDLKDWIKSHPLEDKDETIAQVSDAEEDVNISSSSLDENIGMFKKECVNKLKTYSKVKTTEEKKRTGEVQCDVCKKIFRIPSRLRDHQRLHSTIYACKLCVHTSYNLHTASEHYKSKHIGVKIKCQHCNIMFPTNSRYLIHLRRKHPSTHVCELCGFAFISELYLGLHKSLIHPNALRNPASVVSSGPSCAACDVKFATRQAYNRHLRTSANHVPRDENTHYVYYEKIRISNIYRINNGYKRGPNRGVQKQSAGPIECEQCGLKVGNFREYYVHFRKEHKYKNRTQYPTFQAPAMCEQCGQLCKSQGILEDHQAAVHRGKYLHQCNVCEKTYKTRTSLGMHMYTHKALRYQCDYCQKKFIMKNSLRLHIKTHAQLYGRQKLQPCKVCRKIITKQHLHAHMKLHKPRQRYLCELCDKVLLSKRSLRLHNQSYAHLRGNERVHGDEKLYPCNVCDRKFPKMYISIHKKKHIHQCPQCQIKFTLKENLRRHMQIHMNLRLPCNYCKKIFTSRNNLRAHVSYMHRRDTKE